MKLDTINLQILEELQCNARVPLTEISKKVGLSSPTVSERIQKMEDAGIIITFQYKTRQRLEDFFFIYFNSFDNAYFRTIQVNRIYFV